VLTGGPGGDFLDGRANIDRVFETADANFTLTDGSLTTQIGAVLESDTLVSIERATLIGGPRDNTISAGGVPRHTNPFGGGANDSLVGGSGQNVLNGGAGLNTLNGGAGFDNIVQGLGDTNFVLTDAQLLGLGTDTLININRAQLGITGSTGHTANAAAFSGPVFMQGGDGGDALIGGSAADTIQGFGGNDTITGNAGNDIIDGGLGTDRVVASADTNMTLSNTSLAAGPLGTDTLISIEEAQLTGGSSANRLDASAFSG